LYNEVNSSRLISGRLTGKYISLMNSVKSVRS
jgi:hypothetical protein